MTPDRALPQSMLSGENADFLDELYREWLRDPGSVDPAWRALFEQLDGEPNGVPLDGPRRRPRSIFAAGAPALRATPEMGHRQAKVVQLINAFRVRAHLDAKIDPLGRRERREHEELTLPFYGLTQADLAEEVDTAPAYGLPPRTTLGSLLAHLRKAYTGSIGAEFMNIMDNAQKMWVAEQLETLPTRAVLDPVEERRVFRKLCDAENFERMLHSRFPGTKRFSLEGGETLIPLLDMVVNHASRAGAQELVFGMAHRGRLNVLANILGKPARLVVREFEDVGGTTQGSGDVKYHLGYSADLRTQDGLPIHLSLTPNPSHLEAVNAIVQGRVRAKQHRDKDHERKRVIPVLIHGDAAFSGQGSVMEVLNLSELQGYRTGGTIHVIVNNQIGFTTPPAEGRSTPYATDIARMLAVPIFHVNGEVPRDVAAVTQMALAYRQRFHRDVVIDMYCYRKHGHNEGDEPSFTQPRMYEVIRSKPTPREVYAEHLVKIGTLTEEECDEIHRASFAEMNEAAVEPDAPVAPAALREMEMKDDDPDEATYFSIDPQITVTAESSLRVAESPMKGIWDRYSGGSIRDEVDTSFDQARLVELLRQANSLPEGFTAHSKIKRLMKQRLDVVAGTRRVDWAVGEQAAWASLMDQGYAVRLSGQDSGRGTFSHRHAVVTDIETSEEYYPLQHLGLQAPFHAIDSSLSELGVLGFEVGYAFDTPDALVMWEAQFGDFVNGAQIVIDQYLSASEQKWGRYCGLVMLLPHGYEGQGPEHSSARVERFLQACAEDNMQVANCTTPANFHHLLRRQVMRNVRAPLVVMTPKSLLRHPGATSTLDELASGRFLSVIDDPRGVRNARKVVLCSGKVYFELETARAEAGMEDVSLVRVELLYPFPSDAIRAVLSGSPSASVVWCQEEPRNMGAWSHVFQAWHDEMDGAIQYVGRAAAASPATGSYKTHQYEQQTLLAQALE